MFRSDPNVPPEKKFFHYHSVSVPFDLPLAPGQTNEYVATMPTPTIQQEDFFAVYSQAPLRFEKDEDEENDVKMAEE